MEENQIKDNNDVESFRLPSSTTMGHVYRISITEDKPIMLDYWKDSLVKEVIIGVKDDNEKLLVKSQEEYTSPIAKIFGSEKEYIIVTENSIYVVSSVIDSKRFSDN